MQQLKRRAWRFFTRLKVEYPRIFTPVVVGVLIMAMTAGVTIAVMNISNTWQSQPITVQPAALQVSSNTLNEPTTVEAGTWTSFRITLKNPNPEAVPGYSNVSVGIAVFADEAMTAGSAVLENLVGGNWTAVNLTVSEGRLVGTIPSLAGTSEPGSTQGTDLRVKFAVLGTFWIDVWTTGTVG